MLKVGRISVGPRHPSVLAQLFRKTSLARINTVINYGGSPNKRGRAREGRDSPRRASQLADRTPRRVLSGEPHGPDCNEK